MIQTDAKGGSISFNSQYNIINNRPSIFRSVQSSLEIVLRCQLDQDKKENVQKVISKFYETNNPAVINDMDSQSLAMFTDIRQWIKFMKFGFLEITSEVREYSKFENSDIMDILMMIQPKLNYHTIVDCYRTELLKLKNTYSWTDKFVVQWVNQSVYMKINNIQLFKKKEGPKQIPKQTKTKKITKFVKSVKGNLPQKAQVQTQDGQEPIKKVKKDSLNYKAIVLSIQRILKITQGQQKEMLQQRMKEFMATQNLQYLQLLDQQSAKRIFQMRSYIKLVMDAFVQITEKSQYIKFADRGFIHKIMACQQFIDPDNVLQSYKRLMQLNQLNLQWPSQMISQIIRKVIQLKDIQTQRLMRR